MLLDAYYAVFVVFIYIRQSYESRPTACAFVFCVCAARSDQIRTEQMSSVGEQETLAVGGREQAGHLRDRISTARTFVTRRQ